MSRGNEKPAVVGGSLSDATWSGEHSDVQRDDQFCTVDQQNASGSGLHARRLVAYTLASLSDKERQRAVGNLFPIDDTDIVECARQRVAAEMRDRFRFGVLVDSICCLWRWQLVGFNYFDPAPGTDIDLERGSHLEWLRPGDDDNVVRLVVGDEHQLLVSEDSGNVWTEISIGLLGDTLGDWLAARGAA